MKLIADSGSTKTKFALLSDGAEPAYILTDGINPFYQTSDDIAATLRAQLLDKLPSADVDCIEFYGAGCTAEKSPIVKAALERMFPKADVFVGSDLLGAAKALCGGKPGIACILGTGSNSCLFDGEKIISNVSPLGFIIGDEGSGAVLGKQLIADIFKNQAPADICGKFLNKYGITAAEAIDRIYRKQFPNRFLASFAPFLSENIDNEYCSQLVYNSFVQFIRRNIKQYPDATSYPVHFTGSVAFHFQGILRNSLADEGLSCGLILKDPL